MPLMRKNENFRGLLPWTGSKRWWAVLQVPNAFKSTIIICIWRNRRLIYISEILSSICNFLNIVTSTLTHSVDVYDLTWLHFLGNEVDCFSVGWFNWVQNNNATRPISAPAFSKIYIWTPNTHIIFFLEGTGYAVLFKAMFSVYYWNVIKKARAFSRKASCNFLGLFEGPQFWSRNIHIYRTPI
jgi:hypothetical protein